MRPFRGFGLSSPAYLVGSHSYATREVVIRSTSDITTTKAVCPSLFFHSRLRPTVPFSHTSCPDSPPPASPTPLPIRPPDDELRKRTLECGVRVCRYIVHPTPYSLNISNDLVLAAAPSPEPRPEVKRKVLRKATFCARMLDIDGVLMRVERMFS
ncbi:hypothetical protein C8R45DRAFT_1185012 [Mycena sanguinolenta]|nr:hypothetical protein C8R45DRAFT_1185012 [Mycena sanguinolenta]